MADCANDDGTSIYPSVEYVAWLLSSNERSVQRGIRDLKTLGVLIAVRNINGGRKLTVHYQLHEDSLPRRPTWKEVRARKEKGDNLPPFTEKGDTGVGERVTFSTERVTVVAPDPSVDPSVDPPVRAGAFNHPRSSTLARRSPPPSNGHRKPPAPEKTFLDQKFRPCEQAIEAVQQRCPDVDLELTIIEWRSRRISDGRESTDWNNDFVAFCVTCQKRLSEQKARYAHSSN